MLISWVAVDKGIRNGTTVSFSLKHSLPSNVLPQSGVTGSAAHGPSWTTHYSWANILTCVFRRKLPLSHLWSWDTLWTSRMHSVPLEGFQLSLPLNYYSVPCKQTPALFFSSLRTWLSQAELSERHYESLDSCEFGYCESTLSQILFEHTDRADSRLGGPRLGSLPTSLHVTLSLCKWNHESQLCAFQ